MALQEVTYFKVICDVCGASAHEGDYSAWDNAFDAVEDATDADWWVEPGSADTGAKALCPEHLAPVAPGEGEN